MSEKIAVIGAGVIGQSWAALFAARGYAVEIVDPRPDIAESLQAFLPAAIAQVPGFEGDAEAAARRVTPVADTRSALRGAIVVEEAGPETAAFKQTLWAEAEAEPPADALLLSSSSGIVASTQAAALEDKSRLVIGHPFNPPHILPLVEVSADPETPQAVIDRAMQFYRGLGKHPVQLHKEIDGFVANRLQIALIDEAIKVVNEGVVSPRELDDIVTHSLGIRWASVGPLLAFQLGGGPGGLGHILTHIGIGLATAIGQDDVLTPEAIKKISDAAAADYPPSRAADYAADRDRKQAIIIDEVVTPAERP